MQMTLVQCSLRLVGKSMKQPHVFEWHKWFIESLHVEITNEDNVDHLLQ
jgi:hypothetical protein